MPTEYKPSPKYKLPQNVLENIYKPMAYTRDGWGDEWPLRKIASWSPNNLNNCHLPLALVFINLFNDTNVHSRHDTCNNIVLRFP